MATEGRIGRFWYWILETDKSFHSAFLRRYPLAVPMLDKALEALLGFFSHGALALIVALLLVLLAVSESISITVAVCAGGAWCVAFIWMARAEAIRKLTVLVRLLVVVAIGLCLALVAAKLAALSMRGYARHHSTENIASLSIFAGKVEAKVFSGILEKSTNFAKVIQTPNGCTIEPIQVFMFMRITNNDTREKTITEYFVEQGDAKKNKWLRLKRLDLRSGILIKFATKGTPGYPEVGTTINFSSGNTSSSLDMVDPQIGDYQKVGVINVSSLDNQLGNINLPPGHSIFGWSAFQYSDWRLTGQSSPAGLDTRITIEDEQGKSYQIISKSEQIPTDVSVSPHLLTIAGATDVSSCGVEKLPVTQP